VAHWRRAEPGSVATRCRLIIPHANKAIECASLTSSAESAVSPSDLSEPGCEPSPSARLTAIADGCSNARGQVSPGSEMCDSSTDASLSHSCQSTLFAEDSHARTSPSPAEAPGSTGSAPAYGASMPALLASFDPATSSWKTHQLCLEGGLAEFSETWPRSGTVQSGIAYLLPPLVPLTSEIGSGLWPTPIKRDGRTIKGAARSPNSLGSEPLCVEASRREGVEDGGLNPPWVEWLMGFPPGWTELDRSETRSSRYSRKSSGKRSSKRKRPSLSGDLSE
jgi:hypothetical protein